MEKIFNILIVTILSFAFSNVYAADDTYPVSEKVVNSSTKDKTRPAWVSETDPVTLKNGKYVFVGYSEVPIQSRPRRAYRASDAQAKAEYAALVETNLTRIVAIAENGLELDDIDVSSFVQESSRLSLNNILVTKRYWERVIEIHNDDSEHGLLKVFSLIEVPEKELKTQVKKAVKNSNAPTNFKAQMEVLVVQEWANQ